jgi:hypothetical protein
VACSFYLLDLGCTLLYVDVVLESDVMLRRYDFVACLAVPGSAAPLGGAGCSAMLEHRSDQQPGLSYRNDVNTTSGFPETTQSMIAR